MSAEALRQAAVATEHEAVLVQAWARRRPAWSRSDTTRWLDARSEPLLAWLRRRDPQAPGHCAQMGRWLREHRPAVFGRAHAHLAAGTAEVREAMPIEEALR